MRKPTGLERAISARSIRSAGVGGEVYLPRIRLYRIARLVATSGRIPASHLLPVCLAVASVDGYTGLESVCATHAPKERFA